MARVFKPAQFSLLPETAFGADPWLREPVQSGHCFASNGDEFSGGVPPKAPGKVEAGRSITARETPTPVAWSSREELHAIVEKLPVGQRFAFFCRNIEGLTRDDVQSCMKMYPRDLDGMGRAEHNLVLALRQGLESNEKIEWPSLPDIVLEAYRSIDVLLSDLNQVAPNFDYTLSWNLFPIATKGLENSDPEIRIDAANLAIIFEASLAGKPSQIFHREIIMGFLRKEENPVVRATMIRWVCKIGSRDDHGDHETLAAVVAEHIDDNDKQVRLEVADALVKMTPHLDGDTVTSINALLNLIGNRLKRELSVSVRERLEMAKAGLVAQLKNDAQEAPSSVDAAQFPVAWSSREELHAIVEKLPVGERFAFFCRNIEDLTSDDIQSCLKMCPRDLGDMSRAEHSLVSALYQGLESNGKLECRSLPDVVIEVYRAIWFLLIDLHQVAPHFDYTLSWNLFPIAMRGLENPDPEVRISAVNLAAVFESNLIGIQAKMAREELMVVLEKEKDPEVCANLIYGLGEIGSRNDHGDHLALAGAVTSYLGSDDEGVRIAAIRSSLKIVPNIGAGGRVESLQDIFRDRLKKEKSALVRKWLRTAIAQLDDKSGSVANEAPSSVDAAQFPVAWSTREELLAIVEKIPVGQRFAFFCRNIEDLTSDDIRSCMEIYPRGLGDMKRAELNLVSALRQGLESSGKLEWRSLPGAILKMYSGIVLFEVLLNDLLQVAPNFDSRLSWHLFPIVEKGFGDPSRATRMEAAELATVLEANLRHGEAQIVREALIDALSKEEDSKTRAIMIRCLGEIGSRDSHSDHDKLSWFVTLYLVDEDEGVRLEVAEALFKMAPHLEDIIVIADRLNEIRKRLDGERLKEVRDRLKAAKIKLIANLSDDGKRALLEESIGRLGSQAAEGRSVSPGPKGDRLAAIDRLRALGGRSSAFDNSIAGLLETFWRDVEEEVRKAAFDAWSEVISNLEPEHVLERAEVMKGVLVNWSSNVVHLIVADGLGKLIPLLDVERRLSFLHRTSDRIASWMTEDGSRDDFFARVASVVAANIETLRSNDQQTMARSLHRRLWAENRRIVQKQSNDVVSAYENIGRHLSLADLNDLISRIRRENATFNYEKILAVLIGLPQRMHYEARIIMKAVKRSRAGRTADEGRGYLNRGIHKGNLPTKGGSDFRDLREVRPGEPIGRIDLGATSRTGKVHERIFHQEQSHPVMIVVDPRVFMEVKSDERERIICKIGTIAQMAIAQQDPVGLVIGKGQAYIKPGYDSARLLNILEALGNYKNEGSPTEIEEMLEHRTVRKNAPHGAEIVVVSKFDRRNQDLKGLAKICAWFRACNVCMTPVKIGGAITYATPQVEIGGMKFVPPQDVLDRLAGNMAFRRAWEMQLFLRETGGRYVPERKGDIKVAATDALINLTRHELPDIEPDQVSIRSERVSIDGSVVGVHESVVAAVMRMADEGHPDALDSARYYGVGKLYENIRIALNACFGYFESKVLGQVDIQLVGRLKKAFHDDYEPISGFGGFGNPGLPLAQWAGRELSYEDAFAFGPGRKFWKDFLELYKYLRKKYGTPISKDAPIGERLWVGLTDRLGFGRRGKLFDDSDAAREDAADDIDDLNPDGTPKEQAEDAVWQRVWGLRGVTRKHYLRDSVGIVYDSAHARYLHHAEFSNRSMHIEGGKQVVGKILGGIPGGEFKLPVPVNGMVERVDVTEGGRVQARVHYRVRTKTPDDVEKLKAMSLSAFRREAVSLYGARLYADMTDAVPLDEVPEPMRTEWRTLLPLLDRVSVGTAMCIIQGYFILYCRNLYDEGADRQEKEKRFAEFRERAARGEARGKDEYLSHAIELGGGAFVETPRIAVAFMRMAGIPTALSSGFVVGAFGAVSGKSARVWPEVFFPLQNDEWHGEPIELSEAHPLESTMRLARNAFDEAMSPTRFSLEARVASLSDGDGEDGHIDVHADENAESEMEDEAVVENPVDEQPEVEVSRPSRKYPAYPKRSPIEDVFVQLPALWHRMNEDERARLSNAVSMIPALTQFIGQTWEGTDALINEILLNNWQGVVRHGFYGRTLPLDQARRIIADSIDAARDDDRLRSDLDRWARIALGVLGETPSRWPAGCLAGFLEGVSG